SGNHLPFGTSPAKNAPAEIRRRVGRSRFVRTRPPVHHHHNQIPAAATIQETDSPPQLSLFLKPYFGVLCGRIGRGDRRALLNRAAMVARSSSRLEPRVEYALEAAAERQLDGCDLRRNRRAALLHRPSQPIAEGEYPFIRRAPTVCRRRSND